MKNNTTRRIKHDVDVAFALSDKYYEAGDYPNALRWCFRCFDDETPTFFDVFRSAYPRIVDCYEAMGLHGSAVQWLYLWLDDVFDSYDAEWQEDLPEIYEGLAVNYLNMGKDAQSAYYYNKLIDVDDTLPPEAKLEIAETFAKPKKNNFRFVYPPKLADYSKEVEQGARALKEGNGKRAVECFSLVEKGAKEYVGAKEMQAVAHLLNGETDLAQTVCEDLLKDNPEDVRALATLCAVYLEKGETGKSQRIADALCALELTDTDEIYKVATVCCETGKHAEAFQRFCVLEKEMPYDGRTLYFKAVSAFKSGNYTDAEKTLDKICSIYPYAGVAKYYLDALRGYRCAVEDGETPLPPPEPSYFYCLPQAERELRCKRLIDLTNGVCDTEWGEYEETVDDIRWCFDEMDGADHDLQYLGLLASHKTQNGNLMRNIALNPEVLDAFKIEQLRMLYEANAENEVSFVLCDIYRRLNLLPIKVGVKRKKKFIRAYAKVSSKFAPINDGYGKKLQSGAETLYKDMQVRGALDWIDSEDDLACAIFVSAGIKEIYGSFDAVCAMLDGKPEKVQKLLYGTQENKEEV